MDPVVAANGRQFGARCRVLPHVEIHSLPHVHDAEPQLLVDLGLLEAAGQLRLSATLLLGNQVLDNHRLHRKGEEQGAATQHAGVADAAVPAACAQEHQPLVEVQGRGARRRADALDADPAGLRGKQQEQGAHKKAPHGKLPVQHRGRRGRLDLLEVQHHLPFGQLPQFAGGHEQAVLTDLVKLHEVDALEVLEALCRIFLREVPLGTVGICAVSGELVEDVEAVFDADLDLHRPAPLLH
mmetsp:Transcript_99816/g.282709  ORF Transcript_99816/g.282709 Transcript_99816/m.282709 type:complete len:240 (-) Transcript_99816:872-1591(-)